MYHKERKWCPNVLQEPKEMYMYHNQPTRISPHVSHCEPKELHMYHTVPKGMTAMYHNKLHMAYIAYRHGLPVLLLTHTLGTWHARVLQDKAR